MRRISYLITIIYIFLLSSCFGSGETNDILSHQEMEDILYDYHVAQALVSQSGDSVDFKIRLYAQSIFRKHNVTEEQFDNSLRYYHRNATELHKIYSPLAERLGQAIGSIAEPQYTSEGDTANIWSGKDFYLLSATEKNYLSVQLPPDTLLRKGDKLEWTFTPSWIYKEGKREATAILAVEYEGDTVTTTTHHISSSGPQQLVIRIVDKKMKSINVHVLQNTGWSEHPKLLLLSNFTLIRYHSQANQPKKQEIETSPATVVASPTTPSRKNSISTDSLRLRKDEPLNNDEKQEVVATQKTFHLGRQQ